VAITTIPGATSSDLTTLKGTELADTFALTDNDLYIEGLAGTDTVSSASSKSGLKVNVGSDNDTVTFSGEATSTEVLLQQGNDTLNIQDFSGTVYGSDGQDTITAGATRTVSNSTLRGDGGNDTFTLVNLENSFVNLNSDDDTFSATGSIKTSTIRGGKQKDTITAGAVSGGLIRGDANEDLITVTGTLSSTFINGNDGDDVINVSSAKASSTVVFGGKGADDINITSGQGLTIKAGAGKDDLDITASAAHTVEGGDANDNILYSVAGVTTAREISVDGGAGADTIQVDESAVTSSASASTHTINGGAGKDTITGTAGKDLIDGGTEADTINMNGGSDTVLGKAGNDVINDNGVASNLSIQGGTGDDKLNLNVTNLTLADTIKGEDGTDSIFANVFDAAYDMTVVNSTEAAAFNNVTSIETFGVTAQLTANSTYTFSSAAQTAGITKIDNSGATGDGGAADILKMDMTAFTSAVNLTLTGSNSDAIMDHFIGGSGADTLSTGSKTDGAGAGDTLTGGAGVDTFIVAAAGSANSISDLGTGETFTIASTTEDVVITVTSDFTATTATSNNSTLAKGKLRPATTIDVDMSLATGTVGYDINGNTGASTLKGSAFNDSVDGGAGADLVAGNGGRDALVGAGGADTVLGGAGADTITIGAGKDSITGGDGSDTFIMTGVDAESAAADSVILTDLALLENINVTIGSAPFNLLHDGAGNDVGAEAGDVSTAVDFDAAKILLGAGDNIIDFGTLATGTAGINAALLGGTNNTVIEDDQDALITATDELFYTVRNSGTGVTEIGVITVVGNDSINGVDETYEVFAQSTNTLTSAQVAGLIDFV
jgi:Ca2+-binding RTX toxin-like protein